MFFDIGWPELLVIAIVLVVVVGPKDLPRMLRTFGKTTNKLRSMAGDFRKQFDEALKEAELDEVKTLVSDAKKLDPTSEIKKHLSPMQLAGEQIKSGLDAALKPTPKVSEAAAAPADAAAKPVADGKTTGATANSAAGKTAGAVSKPVSKKTAVKKAPAAKKAAAAKKAPAKSAGRKSTGASS